MSSKLEAKRAELALLEAEEAFVAKKKAGKLTNEDRLALRQHRHDFRVNHRGPKPGAAVAAIGPDKKADK